MHPQNPDSLPADFVDIAIHCPDIDRVMSYATRDNFLGRVVTGYTAPRALLTRMAADALTRVQTNLNEQGYGLRIFDAYRPQRAVNAFIAWTQEPDLATYKAQYYPELDKTGLFKQGYLAQQSSHSRGSTVDLTIIKRTPACLEALDMGTAFDFFGPDSHTHSPNITATAQRHRQWLVSLMNDAGFDNLPTEWWHYTLRNEPYPDQYFDIEIR